MDPKVLNENSKRSWEVSTCNQNIKWTKWSADQLKISLQVLCIDEISCLKWDYESSTAERKTDNCLELCLIRLFVQMFCVQNVKYDRRTMSLKNGTCTFRCIKTHSELVSAKLCPNFVFTVSIQLPFIGVLEQNVCFLKIKELFSLTNSSFVRIFNSSQWVFFFVETLCY